MKKQKEIIDEKQLKKSVETAKAQPRLTFYSPVAAAVLNYRKNVIPRYSISDELSKMVESALAKKYPGLTLRVKRMMKSGNKASKETGSTRRGQESNRVDADR